MIKFYKTGDLLIKYNSETDVYKYRNNINLSDTRLSTLEFVRLDTVQIKKQEFSRLMNEYFKSVKHEWTFNFTPFRKLSNFEVDEHGDCTNYDDKEIPLHNGNLMLVYHWGKVYHFNWSYNGYPQGQLIDIESGKMVRWAKPKHCAPIFNVTTKKIV